MSNGDHAIQLARLDERDRDILRRLSSIEQKLDGLTESHSALRAKVAGWAAGVTLLTMVAVEALSRTWS